MNRLLFENYKEGLDDLLYRIAESIQLDETRKTKMESAYGAIEKLLNADESFFSKYDFEIYPQGSVKIGTTVKPQGKNEFDLDIVVHLKTYPQGCSSSLIYNELKRVITSNDTYKEKCETKNRCIRINYSGDFHMDILPGIQINQLDDEQLFVPDRELHNWTSSNPKGYARWFIDQTEKTKVTLLEKAFSRDALEFEQFINKKPLKIAVQLLKMYRDQYFDTKNEYKTTSIIITTIAGMFYDGAQSVSDTIKNIVTEVNKYSSNGEFWKITNPNNNNEVLNEKWLSNSNYALAFADYIGHMKNYMEQLEIENMQENEKVLKKMFSEESYVRGLESVENAYNKNRAIKTQNFSGLKKLAATTTPEQKPYSLNE